MFKRPAAGLLCARHARIVHDLYTYDTCCFVVMAINSCADMSALNVGGVKHLGPAAALLLRLHSSHYYCYYYYYYGYDNDYYHDYYY